MTLAVRRVWPIIFVVFMVACTPSEAAIQAAIQATADAAPTETATHASQPTSIPRPTDTPHPTNTPEPTETPDPHTPFIGIWFNPNITIVFQNDDKATLILSGQDPVDVKWKLAGNELCLYADFYQDRCSPYQLQDDRLQLGNVVYQRQNEVPPTLPPPSFTVPWSVTPAPVDIDNASALIASLPMTQPIVDYLTVLIQRAKDTLVELNEFQDLLSDLIQQDNIWTDKGGRLIEGEAGQVFGTFRALEVIEPPPAAKDFHQFFTSIVFHSCITPVSDVLDLLSGRSDNTTAPFSLTECHSDIGVLLDILMKYIPNQ